MADWDADDFEPDATPAATAVPSDKWEGEDEDDDVKVWKILWRSFFHTKNVTGRLGCRIRGRKGAGYNREGSESKKGCRW